jgi:hypothetical protein
LAPVVLPPFLYQVLCDSGRALVLPPFLYQVLCDSGRASGLF